MYRITNISIKALTKCEQTLKFLRQKYNGTNRPKDLSLYFKTLQDAFSSETTNSKTKNNIKSLKAFSANNINQLLFIVSLLKLFMLQGKALSSINFFQWAENEFGFIIDYLPINLLVRKLKDNICYFKYEDLSDIEQLKESECSMIKLVSLLELLENNPKHCKLSSFLNTKDNHDIYYLSEKLDSDRSTESRNEPHIQTILHKEQHYNTSTSINKEIKEKIRTLEQLYIITKMEDGSPVSMKNTNMITSYYSQYLKIIFELSRSIPHNLVFVFPSVNLIKKIFSYQQIYLTNISIYKNIFFETESYFDNRRITDIFKSKSTKGNVLFLGYHSPMKEILCGNFVTVLCGFPTTDYNNINRYVIEKYLDWITIDNIICVDSYVMQDSMRRAFPDEFLKKWNDGNVSLTVQKVVKKFDLGRII